MVEANMDLLAWLRKRLEEAEPEVLREMVKSFAEALMGNCLAADTGTGGSV